MNEKEVETTAGTIPTAEIVTQREDLKPGEIKCGACGKVFEGKYFVMVNEEKCCPSCWQMMHTPIHCGKKVGRNEPCVCKSGKKYKKCCLGKIIK